MAMILLRGLNIFNQTLLAAKSVAHHLVCLRMLSCDCVCVYVCVCERVKVYVSADDGRFSLENKKSALYINHWGETTPLPSCDRTPRGQWASFINFSEIYSEKNIRNVIYEAEPAPACI